MYVNEANMTLDERVLVCAVEMFAFLFGVASTWSLTLSFVELGVMIHFGVYDVRVEGVVPCF